MVQNTWAHSFLVPCGKQTWVAIEIQKWRGVLIVTTVFNCTHLLPFSVTQPVFPSYDFLMLQAFLTFGISLSTHFCWVSTLPSEKRESYHQHIPYWSTCISFFCTPVYIVIYQILYVPVARLNATLQLLPLWTHSFHLDSPESRVGIPKSMWG